MSSPLTNYQSPESRRLSTITSDSYDYRDQAKVTSKLVNDVSYLAGMQRKMQKGIDDANQNFMQQIQSLINDILVILGGGGDTGLDFGDFKYLLQMIGSLFGFQPGNPLSWNVFTAAWHFFSNYILPIGNFEEAINMIVDGLIATILDVFGEIPVVGQALQQLAVFISEIRDLLLPLNDAINLFFDSIGIAMGDTMETIGNLFEVLWAMLGTVTLPIANLLKPILPSISSWTQPFISALSHVIDVITNLLNGLTNGLHDFQSLWSNFNPLTLIANVINQLVTKGIHAILPAGNLVGNVASSLLTGVINILRIPDMLASKITGGTFDIARIPQILASMVTGVFDILRIPDLSANKITSGILDVIRIPELAITKITGLVGELANRIKNAIFGGYVRSGVNLASDSEMSIPEYWVSNHPNNTFEIQTSSLSYSGNTRLKVTSLKNNAGITVDLLRTADGAPDYMTVNEGDKFEASVMVKKGTPQQDVVSQVALRTLFSDSKGVNADLNTGVSSYGAANTSQNLEWTLNATTQPIVVPAGYDRMRIFLTSVSTQTQIGYEYFIDRPIINEITKSQNIIESFISSWGSAGQTFSQVINAIPGVKLVGSVASSLLTGFIDVANRIASVPANLVNGFLDIVTNIPGIPGSKINSGTIDPLRIVNLTANHIVSGVMSVLRIPNLGRSKIIGTNDLSNVLEDGGFESPDSQNPGGGTIVTISDPAVGGTKALQQVSTGGNVDSSLQPLVIEVKPGQYWYIKGRIRKTTTGTVGQAGVYMTTTLDGASPSYPAFAAVPGGLTNPAFNLSTLTQNQWVEFEGIYQIPAGKNRMAIRPSIRSSVPVGQTIQYDDLEVREVTMQRSFIDDIAAAWGQAGQSLTTIFNNIPGAKLVGQVASSLLTGFIDVANRISSIPSSLLTGFIDLLRIPGLPANKIESGQFDPLRIPELAISKIIDLGTELGKRLSSAIFGGWQRGGINLASDPDMSIPELWAQTSNNSIVTSGSSRSGTTCLSVMTDVAGGYTYARLLRTTDGGNGFMSVKEGQRFEVGAFVRAYGSNVATRNARIWARFSDSKGVNTATSPAGPNSAPPVGSMKEYSYEFETPAGYDRVEFAVQFMNTGSVVGDYYWIDDPYIFEVTKTSNIIETFVSGWGSAGQNLATVINNIPGAKLVGQVASSLLTGTIDVINRITSIPANLVNGFLDAVSNIPGLPGSKINSGTVDQARIGNIPATKVTSGQFPPERLQQLPATKIDGQFPQTQVQNLGPDLLGANTKIDNSVKGLASNLLGTPDDYDQDGANTAVDALRKTIADQSQSISDLQADDQGSSFGGTQSQVIFNGNTALPSSFTATYSGSGNAIVAVVDNLLTLGENTNGNDRNVRCIFNVKTTETDYMKVGAIFATAPGTNTFNSNLSAENRIIVRSNAAGTSYVFVQFRKNHFDIGCVVNNVVTIWKTVGHAFRTGSLYQIEAGTAVGLRIFRVICNGVLLDTHTEVGTTSQMGASFRSGGLWFETDAATKIPARVASFRIQDNTPPSYIGVTFRWNRTNTGGVAHSSGTFPYPTNFYDSTPVINTGHFTPASARNGAVTVGISGTYALSMHTKLASNIAANTGISAAIARNAVWDQVGGGIWGYTAFGASGGGGDYGYTFIIYLQEGDTVQPGYSGGGSIPNAVGTSDAGQTYFTLSLMNRSSK